MAVENGTRQESRVLMHFFPILYDGGLLQDYANYYYYSIEMYTKAFNSIIYLMFGENQWIIINYDNMDPPKHRIYSTGQAQQTQEDES